MLSIKQLADILRRNIARSGRSTRLALRLRRQIDGIVAHRLGHDTSPATNGEDWLLDTVAGSCQTFVDIGANVGEWSLAMLERAPLARGIVVEPSEEALAVLRGSSLVDRVTLIAAAASEKPGTATFFEEPGAGRTSSLHAHAANSAARKREVDVTTVDKLLAESGWDKIDVLKVDAEGNDFLVLRGAADALKNQKIGILQFEYNEPWLKSGATLGMAYDLLEAAGYSVFLLKGPKLYTFPISTYGEYFHYSNFVAVSPATMTLFSIHRFDTI